MWMQTLLLSMRNEYSLCNKSIMPPEVMLLLWFRSKYIFLHASVNAASWDLGNRLDAFTLSKIPRPADALYFLEMTILGARNLAAPFWTRSGLDFRARFACLKCPNHAYNLIELSPEMNDFAIMTANDRGFFLNERCLLTRRNNPGFDLARKQGCAFSLMLRRRYVLLIAASISLLTQRDTMMTIL